MDDRLGVNVDISDPETAWTALVADPQAQLVDVRTRPEWAYVGIPDLSGIGRQAILLEWRRFPDMRVEEGFAEQLFAAFGDTLPSQVFFICRSGARSMEAAVRFSEFCADRKPAVRCVNVAEGFEGDLDSRRHRGVLNGWKARGLAWLQS